MVMMVMHWLSVLKNHHVIIDMIGDFMGDPGSGWSVAGVSNATKDHTLLRKMSVTSGNDWALSAGTSAMIANG